jgi:UTRA domain
MSNADAMPTVDLPRLRRQALDPQRPSSADALLARDPHVPDLGTVLAAQRHEVKTPQRSVRRLVRPLTTLHVHHASGITAGDERQTAHVDWEPHRSLLLRYRRRTDAAPPFASDAKAAGQTSRWEHRSREERASLAIAQRLAIEPGHPVMVTDYHLFADHERTQLSISYEPLAITRGTPVELPEDGAAVGIIARMDAIGQRVTEVHERVTTRAPRPHEIPALAISAGVPVLVIVRTHYADATPVETADIIVPATAAKSPGAPVSDKSGTLRMRQPVPSRHNKSRAFSAKHRKYVHVPDADSSAGIRDLHLLYGVSRDLRGDDGVIPRPRVSNEVIICSPEELGDSRRSVRRIRRGHPRCNIAHALYNSVVGGKEERIARPRPLRELVRAGAQLVAYTRDAEHALVSVR